jgi:prepilin-type N-terminal cleavage/methylation domain-containing protein
MRLRTRQSGLTLTELLVTMAIAAVLMGLAMPAAKRLSESMQSSAGAHGIINAALSSARAIAVREQKYAGVRFQRAADGRTHIILIEHDTTATGLANGFRVADGRKPIALPEDTGVIDGFWVDRVSLVVFNDISLGDVILSGDIRYGTNRYFEDASTFSIVFSPAGRLIVHEVRIRNKDGRADNLSYDAVFNTQSNVNIGRGMFFQDDYPASGIGWENSRTRLIIYSKRDLAAINAAQRWSGYLGRLNTLMVSPYSGELIGD